MLKHYRIKKKFEQPQIHPQILGSRTSITLIYGNMARILYREIKIGLDLLTGKAKDVRVRGSPTLRAYIFSKFSEYLQENTELTQIINKHYGSVDEFLKNVRARVEKEVSNSKIKTFTGTLKEAIRSELTERIQARIANLEKDLEKPNLSKEARDGILEEIKNLRKDIERIEELMKGKETRRMLDKLHYHIMEAKHKGGIVYDPIDNEVYVIEGDTVRKVELEPMRKGEGRTPEHEKFLKIVKYLEERGLKIRESYYSVRNKQIIYKAIMQGSTPEEIQKIYMEEHKRLLREDPMYAQGYIEHLKNEIRKTAQAGAIMHSFHSTLTRLPAMVVSMLSRMMAQVLRLLPILGAVASVSAEAAQLAVGIGEELRGRIEQSSHVFHSLPSQYLGDVGKQIEAWATEQMKNNF